MDECSEYYFCPNFTSTMQQIFYFQFTYYILFCIISRTVNGVPNGVNGGPPLPEHVMRAVNEQMQRFLQNTMHSNNNLNNNTVSGGNTGDSSGRLTIYFPCVLLMCKYAYSGRRWVVSCRVLIPCYLIIKTYLF